MTFKVGQIVRCEEALGLELELGQLMVVRETLKYGFVIVEYMTGEIYKCDGVAQHLFSRRFSEISSHAIALLNLQEAANAAQDTP